MTVRAIRWRRPTDSRRWKETESRMAGTGSIFSYDKNNHLNVVKDDFGAKMRYDYDCLEM